MVLDDRATGFTRANGLTFACQRFGAGPAIVLVRGLGTQMIEWSPVLIDTLVVAGFEVVVFDNRDAGRSSRLKHDYQLNDMAADVVALMDALGLPAFHVFGISLGGMVAQLVAVGYPERVLSLISVMSSSGAPGLPLASPEVRARLRATAVDRDSIIDLETENREIFGSPGYPESAAVRRRMSEAAYDRSYCPEGVERQFKAASDDGSRVARLGGIDLPALVIHGADDPLLLPACGEDTARRITGAAFTAVPGMGHNIPDALAPEIGRLVADFLVALPDRNSEGEGDDLPGR